MNIRTYTLHIYYIYIPTYILHYATLYYTYYILCIYYVYYYNIILISNNYYHVLISGYIFSEQGLKLSDEAVSVAGDSDLRSLPVSMGILGSVSRRTGGP